MKKISLLLVDDQSIIREGIKSMLSACDDIEIIGEADNGRQAIELCDRLKPQIVLTDIRMPVMNGVEATKIIKKQFPETIVIVLTTFDDDDYILDALTGGAAGYLLKDISSAQLVQALRDSVKGSLILPGRIAAKITARLTGSQTPAKTRPEPDFSDQSVADDKKPDFGSGGSKISETDNKSVSPEHFSSREHDIIRLLVRGHSNREIADTLFLTTGTVKNYISQIYMKLGVSDRANAIIALQDLEFDK